VVPICAEYVWIDGTEPTPKLRSKTKVLTAGEMSKMNPPLVSGVTWPPNISSVPVWGFDGSSTGQAAGSASDCILRPVRVIEDTIRSTIPGYKSNIIVLCEVWNADGSPSKTNHRHETANALKDVADQDPWFGIEQEYTFFKGSKPLGWPDNGFPAPQGPFYCGVGADEVFGREIVEDHIQACLKSGIILSGVNAEVMPGQWEFQVGPGDPLLVSDHLWLARYLLYRTAEKYGVNVKLDPKPVNGDWNGSGAHTNFSTKDMREGAGAISGFECCKSAARRLESDFHNMGFPDVYGDGFEKRLTGAHETCSFRQFKWGVSDRTASIRIPLHVKENGCGYIEDRRPCSNIDPYQVCSYIMQVVCEEVAVSA